MCAGNVPSTDLMRHAGNAEKLYSRCVLHGMLRFTKMTRTIPQGAQFICSVATDDKYKGKIKVSFFYDSLVQNGHIYKVAAKNVH